ncbi:hypothetical protein QJS10_CPA06g01214 [Acorus calamus]|uniref:Uncharacterized protein n=1 Tax=Acorus calamus TaxID=4465 RepID=A0AAV9ELE2_ACOCL|nr:hypothetical protein QJS10_CPA06g01214 [Acorus calamus]
MLSPKPLDDDHHHHPSSIADGWRRRGFGVGGKKGIEEGDGEVPQGAQHVGVPLFDARRYEIQDPLHPAIPTTSFSLPPSDLTVLSVIRPSIDELLLQMVDAQVTLIGEMENLCDMAEALVAEEERVTRSLLKLPIWGSPRDLVAIVADGGGDSDSN